MSMISWCKGKIRRSELVVPAHRTPMEQYAMDYPGCRFVGFWRRYERFDDYGKTHLGYPNDRENDIKDALPWPADLVDETQDPLILEAVAQYLDDCPFGEHCMGFSWCRICGKELGCSNRTDGEWVWPDQLSHYLRVHKVRLPDDFVEHIFRPLKKGGRDAYCEGD